MNSIVKVQKLMHNSHKFFLFSSAFFFFLFRIFLYQLILESLEDRLTLIWCFCGDFIAFKTLKITFSSFTCIVSSRFLSSINACPMARNGRPKVIGTSESASQSKIMKSTGEKKYVNFYQHVFNFSLWIFDGAIYQLQCDYCWDGRYKALEN